MGDGAGIMLQIPTSFFARSSSLDGVTLPAEGEYGIGMVFLPKEQGARLACERAYRTSDHRGRTDFIGMENCRLTVLFLCRQE